MSDDIPSQMLPACMENRTARRPACMGRGDSPPQTWPRASTPKFSLPGLGC